MHCFFCNDFVPDTTSAIEADWYPDFWHGEEYYAGPVCPVCFARYLAPAEDNTPVIWCDKKGRKAPLYPG